MSEEEHELPETDEMAGVVRWRRREALEAGLTRVEARLYAEAQDIDSSQLRRLVKAGCPPELLARLLL